MILAAFLFIVVGLFAGFVVGRDRAEEKRLAFRHACITDLQSVDECMRIFP